MTLQDLLDLRRPGMDGAPTLEELLRDPRIASLRWPVPVIEQFLYEHGRYDHFLADYGTLDLTRIDWALESLLAAHLRHYPTGPSEEGLLQAVADNHADRLSNYPAEVRNRWEQAGTWLVPPILIDRGLLDPPGEGLQVIEGRTRVGILRGRISDRLMVARRLDVWVGRHR